MTAPRTTAEDAAREQRTALLRLFLIIAAGFVASLVTGVTKVVLVVFAIIVMIMLHELGHFLTAKWAGMKVTEYFLGFGPRLWSIKRGETEYGVKAIPAGGYVKIIGMSNIEEVDPEDEPRTYRAKPYWRRLTVAVAGSTVHFILAFILLFTTLTVVGTVDGDRELPQIGSISALEAGPSPAQQAGFQVGDRILSYDGNRFSDWDALRSYIRPRPGQAITFEVERKGQRVVVTPTPANLADIEVEGGGPVVEGDQPYGFIGIGPAFPVEKAGIGEAFGKTASGMGEATTQTAKVLGNLFSPSGATSYFKQLTGRETSAEPDPETPRFLSPVGFVKVAGDAAESGWRDVLVLLFLINIFVGIFNMIPLPPFDGGHVAIATYEKIRSRPGRPYRVDMAKVMPVAYLVFMMLVTLGLTSLYLDIVRPPENPFQ
jgi:membrane-associated protease RseP (regulator of RpoE activity)